MILKWKKLKTEKGAFTTLGEPALLRASVVKKGERFAYEVSGLHTVVEGAIETTSMKEAAEVVEEKIKKSLLKHLKMLKKDQNSE